MAKRRFNSGRCTRKRGRVVHRTSEPRACGEVAPPVSPAPLPASPGLSSVHRGPRAVTGLPLGLQRPPRHRRHSPQVSGRLRVLLPETGRCGRLCGCKFRAGPGGERPPSCARHARCLPPHGPVPPSRRSAPRGRLLLCPDGEDGARKQGPQPQDARRRLPARGPGAGWCQLSAPTPTPDAGVLTPDHGCPAGAGGPSGPHGLHQGI